jgi:hypothetical protein
MASQQTNGQLLYNWLLTDSITAHNQLTPLPFQAKQSLRASKKY